MERILETTKQVRLETDANKTEYMILQGRNITDVMHREKKECWYVWSKVVSQEERHSWHVQGKDGKMWEGQVWGKSARFGIEQREMTGNIFDSKILKVEY